MLPKLPSYALPTALIIALAPACGPQGRQGGGGSGVDGGGDDSLPEDELPPGGVGQREPGDGVDGDDRRGDDPRGDDDRQGPDFRAGLASGDACDSDEQCQGGVCLSTTGGYCTTLGCSPGECPGSDAKCVTLRDGRSTACFDGCVIDEECRVGYACKSDGTCLPGTRDPGQDPGPIDDPGDGGDGGDVPWGETSVGETCGDDSECFGPPGQAACLDEAHDFPGGYCAIFDCRPGSCPEGSDCFQVSQDGTAACLATCAVEADCRPGYECVRGAVCLSRQGGGGDDIDPEPDPIPDPGPGELGVPGDACDLDADCEGPGGRARCLAEEDGFPAGYCAIFDCEQGECPGGSDCFQIAEDGSTACLATCDGGCRGGYECVQGLACMPIRDGGGGGDGGGGDVDPGDDGPLCENTCGPEGQPGAWAGDGECDDGGPGAQYAGCELGTDCADCGARGCDQDNPCPDGSVCRANLCEALGCADEGGLDCGRGQVCRNNVCVADVGGAPDGPAPRCDGVASWRCDGNANQCAQLVPFEPDRGPGYWDYPLNGESDRDQYRSYARRDLMALVKHAAGMVDCQARGWDFGNFEPLGLGDMSEANGAIPGSREGQPGHPQGTHVDGHDMDIAYFQLGTPDNTLRPVCDHVSGGRDQYHCVAEPASLDLWRTALFIGHLHATPHLRVIGVDGRIGPAVEAAIQTLCAEGFLDNGACRGDFRLAYEVQDEGRGWFRFHHHHLHISISDPRRMVVLPNPADFWGPEAVLSLEGRGMSYPADPYGKGSHGGL